MMKKKCMKYIFYILVLVILMQSILIGCGKEGKTMKRIDRPENLNDFEFTVNHIVATDNLGRSFYAVNEKKDKDVGLFYFIHRDSELNSKTQRIYDITKLLSTPEGAEKLWSAVDNQDSPLGASHWWGEPLYGYYSSTDEWVIRKHIELFCLSDIDFLYFDVTNGPDYYEAYIKVAEILHEFNEQGWDAPKLMFYTNSYSKNVITKIYNDFYKKNMYPDTWYCPNGKPLIVGCTSGDKGPAQDITALSAEIKEFFELRSSQWPSLEINEEAMPWMDYSFPQTNYNGTMNVSVMQHLTPPVSRSVWFKDDFAIHNSNHGRGYSDYDGLNDENRVMEGSNFEEQWENVHFYDPDCVTITGWNEWTVGKYTYGEQPGVMFVDNFTMEFSRDLEMMRGGYEDNYFLQNLRNIKKFKSASPDYFAYNKIIPDTFTFDFNEVNWKDKESVYVDFKGDTAKRNAKGAAVEAETYTDETGRNDIVKTRVLHTKDGKLYFMIETADKIVQDFSDTTFMNILISTGGEKNWKGYDYIVNRYPTQNGTTSLEKATGNGYEFQKVADLKMQIVENKMIVEIPLEILGQSADSVEIQFKVADHVKNPSDIMDYYVTGDCAPLGRLNYLYKY